MTTIRQSDRAFGLTFAAVFAIIGLVGWLVFEARLIWAPVAASVFLLVALAAPGILLPLNRLWARIAHRVGLFSNALLLGSFFFLFVLLHLFLLCTRQLTAQQQKCPATLYPLRCSALEADLHHCIEYFHD